MPATKEHIIEEIRRHFNGQNGGHVSLGTFTYVTGIPKSEILGKHWATWNSALIEAGVTPRYFGMLQTIDERSVIEAVAEFVERLKKWPTRMELKVEKNRNSSFPSLYTIDRIEKLDSKILSLCAESPGLANAAKVTAERMKAKEGESIELWQARVRGFVYMMKFDHKYMIGHTKCLAHLYHEAIPNLPNPSTIVHTIETDDPNGIESYWLQRFKAKRIQGTELFDLDPDEIRAFKLRIFQ